MQMCHPTLSCLKHPFFLNSIFVCKPIIGQDIILKKQQFYNDKNSQL